MPSVVDIVLYQVIPVLVLLVGTLNNLFGIILFSNEKVKKLKIVPTYVYTWLFVFDEIVVLQLLHGYLYNAYKINILDQPDFVCRIYKFSIAFTTYLSPFMLVYISLDHLISIKFAIKRDLLKKTKIQCIFIGLNLLFNFAQCIPNYLLNAKQTYLSYLSERKLINVTAMLHYNISLANYQFYVCDYVSVNSQVIMSFKNLIVRNLLPYILMLICSITVLITIYQSKNVIQQSNNLNTARFHKDVQFSISSVFLNIFYMLMILPVTLSLFQINIFQDYLFVNLASYVFFFSYGINFLIIFCTNSVFRNCFYTVFKLKKNAEFVSETFF